MGVCDGFEHACVGVCDGLCPALECVRMREGVSERECVCVCAGVLHTHIPIHAHPHTPTFVSLCTSTQPV